MSSHAFEDGVLTFPHCERLRLTRENTGLWTFTGRNSMKNHVFVICEGGADHAEDPTAHPRMSNGHYFFSQDPIFPDLTNYVIENRFYQVLNATNVGEFDDVAYFQTHFLTLMSTLEEGPRGDN